MRAKTSAADPTTWLSIFRVDLVSASNQLYNNGNQQLAINITATVRDGQPELTETQFSSMKLVLEVGEGEYEEIPFDGAGNYKWWQWPTLDERFDLMPPRASLAPAKPMYVTSTAIANTVVKLRGMIQKDADTIYYTEKIFDTSISAQSINPPEYNASDFNLELGWEEGDITNTFYHEYILTLADVRFSTEFSLDVSGMIRWHDNSADQTYATYVGMSPPGSRKIIYNSAITIPVDFEPKTQTQHENQNAFVLVLHGANNIRFKPEDLVHDGPCTITLVDRNGNAHSLGFQFLNEGTNLEKRTKIRHFMA